MEESRLITMLMVFSVPIDHRLNGSSRIYNGEKGPKEIFDLCGELGIRMGGNE